jgi:transcriptional regulator with XRE-family HTH domain
MAARRLPNYLRTYRKRSGLSQDDVAFLLGCQSGAKVSRYERFARVPTLETALTYEALFGVPARELFAGVYQKVEETIHKRAQVLGEKLNAAKPDRTTLQKLENLTAMTSAAALEPNDHGLHLDR